VSPRRKQKPLEGSPELTAGRSPETDRDTPLYMISVISELLGVHPQTLRLYEREGFVHPRRTRGGTRLYSERDLEAVRRILHLTRDLGMNLAGVEVVLEMRRKMERMQEELEEALEFMRREMKREVERWRTRNALVRVKPSSAARRPPPRPPGGQDGG
jgi:MerR family transcriptional regulator/heat shock protein HspR